ncbi:MAG: hypothetical protein BWY28_02890 [bacterium ADurb.Bin236]|nr:MAG: hypothetical protein BWY28_02890 [bacterium ADurb.Bin236]HOY62079.1 hypothetical protein [bacterium]HPN93739.1 hypothetical protein [bacterium]
MGDKQLLRATRKSPRDGQSGSVILMTMFIIFFLAALMITVEMLRLSDLEDVTNQIEDMQAYYCAEAGIEYFLNLHRFNNNVPPLNFAADVTLPQLPCTSGGGFGNSTWTYQVRYYNSKACKRDLNANGSPDSPYYNLLHVISTGRTTRFTRRVRADIHRPSEGAYIDSVEIRRWREL